MIEGLKNYTYLIIISVFITNLIQLIAPKGETRKYILFVSGTVVMIILLEPVLKIINNEINIENILVMNQEKYMERIEENENILADQIKETYKKNIESGIIKHLEDLGYVIHFIRCEYDLETLEPDYIFLEVSIDDDEIRPVKIEVSNTVNDESFLDELKIESILKQVYGFKEVEVSAWKKY